MPAGHLSPPHIPYHDYITSTPSFHTYYSRRSSSIIHVPSSSSHFHSIKKKKKKKKSIDDCSLPPQPRKGDGTADRDDSEEGKVRSSAASTVVVKYSPPPSRDALDLPSLLLTLTLKTAQPLTTYAFKSRGVNCTVTRLLTASALTFELNESNTATIVVLSSGEISVHGRRRRRRGRLGSGGEIVNKNDANRANSLGRSGGRHSARGEGETTVKTHSTYKSAYVACVSSLSKASVRRRVRFHEKFTLRNESEKTTEAAATQRGGKHGIERVRGDARLVVAAACEEVKRIVEEEGRKRLLDRLLFD